MRTILVTGFGPFPGAPHNPTATLVRQLTRGRRPLVRLVGHVFDTSYEAVDRELPALIKQHRPDALLMFGLHGRARTLRIETRAANAIGRHADARGKRPSTRTIAAGGTHASLPIAAHRLMRAAHRVTPAALSRDAGRYLCNYLCWRAAEASAKPGGPRLATFVHVPRVSTKALRKRSKGLTAARLARAGAAILAALPSCR